MAPATAAVAAYLCSRLGEAGVAPIHAAQAALLYGVGTPVLFRAAHLNHNLLVCNAGFAALLLLWDPRNAPVRAGRAAVAGLLAGYTVLCDYSGVVVVAVVALYVWLRSAGGRPAARWKILAAYAAGVAPGIVGLTLYQAWAFGDLLRPSQHYMVPTAPTSHGYRGIDWPSPALLAANFFDPRFGLFAYCPALLLALAAPFCKTRQTPRSRARDRSSFPLLPVVRSVLRGQPVFLAAAPHGLPIPCAGGSGSRPPGAPDSRSLAAKHPANRGGRYLRPEHPDGRRLSEQLPGSRSLAVGKGIRAAMDDTARRTWAVR